MGEEFAEYKPKTPEQNKIDWTLLGNDTNKGLHDYYQSLIFLRKNNHALFTENIEFFYENPDDRVLAYTRWNDEGSRVVVIANLSGNFLKDYTIPHVPADGTWHEWVSNYDVEVSGNTLVLDLPEHEAKVLML
jgi:1,4-alpha-glucan branching enzyme